MDLLKQVCSLEQAIKLAKLGIVRFEHGTGFYYHTSVDGHTSLYFEEKFASTHRCIAAFTVAELGVMLPCRVWKEGEFYELSFTKSDNTWHEDGNPYDSTFNYEYQKHDDEVISVLANYQSDFLPEAQARAAMLIWLLEQNHITASQVNNRIKNG